MPLLRSALMGLPNSRMVPAIGVGARGTGTGLRYGDLFGIWVNGYMGVQVYG